MKQLNHVSYEKIASNFNKYQLTEADYRLFKKTDWIVTEKIHGANFCIISDGNVVNFAKRKAILSPEDDFFGYQLLKDWLESKTLAIFNRIKQLYPHTQQIAIYGELFGGEYPHSEVKINPKVDAIQTGVYYSPNIEFIAFDLAYINIRQERYYLDTDTFIDLCDSANLRYIPILFRGKYQEALAYKIEFTTTIPPLLNLPPLETENIAEGIVIKPASKLFIETVKGKLRPVLKIKNPQFAEDKRFHQAQKWNYNRYGQQQQSVTITDKLLIEEAANLITINRLNNLISKLGRSTFKNKKQRDYILKLYVRDVIEDLETNLNIVLNDLNANIQEKVTSFIEREARIFIDNNSFSHK